MGRGKSNKVGNSSRGNISLDDSIRASRDYIGSTNVESQISEQIRYGMLGEGEDLVAINSFTIDTNPGNGDVGNVTAEYQVRVDTSYDDYDSDGERYTVRDSETEYRTDTFQVVLKKRNRRGGNI